MNIRRHTKEGKKRSETFNHGRRRDIGAWKHKRKPGEFVDHVEKVLILIRRWQRAFKVNIDPF